MASDLIRLESGETRQIEIQQPGDVLELSLDPGNGKTASGSNPPVESYEVTVERLTNGVWTEIEGSPVSSSDVGETIWSTADLGVSQRVTIDNTGSRVGYIGYDFIMKSGLKAALSLLENIQIGRFISTLNVTTLAMSGGGGGLVTTTDDPVIIGDGASVFDDLATNIAIGQNASILDGAFGNTLNIAIGPDSETSTFGAIAIGDGAVSDIFDSIAIGRDASASGEEFNGNVIAIGPGASTTGSADNSIAIGPSATTPGDRGTVLGTEAEQLNQGSETIVIGYQAQNRGANSTVIGASTLVEDQNSNPINNVILIGRNGVSQQQGSVVIGSGASAERIVGEANATVIGNSAITDADGAVVIGASASLDQTVASSDLTNVGLIGVDALIYGGVPDHLDDGDFQNNQMAGEMVPGDSAFRFRGRDGSGDFIRDQTRDTVSSVSSSGQTDGTGMPQTELVDTSAGTFTRTLASADAAEGTEITIKDSGGNANSNNITVDTEGGETIDGAPSITLDADNESVTLVSDGSNWFVKSRYDGTAL